MKNSKFIPEPNTSYSAGLAYLIFPNEDSIPKIILILQKAGEKNLLKGDRFFIEKRTWKMPMGHFDFKKDSDLIDTAVREFQEETGLEVKKTQLSLKHSAILRIRSDRPGQEFHEDRFFLVISDKKPKKAENIKMDGVIERVEEFSLNFLPLDNSPANGATLARGQRRKLAVLLSECRNDLIKSGLSQDSLNKILFSLEIGQ